jgi:hypothetical protein
MNVGKGLWMTLPALVLLLTACYEEPKVTFFKPGEYQGRTDPLLALEASPQQQQELLQRLRTGQTDR